MNKNLKITLLIIAVGGVMSVIWLFDKLDQEEERIREGNALYMEYEGAADLLHMKLDESKYEQTNNPDDLLLVPTEFTYDLLKRWKAFSDIFPEIKYPLNSIKSENWIEVRKVFANNWIQMENASREIGEKMADEYDEPVSTDVIQSYISHNEIITDYFGTFLEKEGIINSK